MGDENLKKAEQIAKEKIASLNSDKEKKEEKSESLPVSPAKKETESTVAVEKQKDEGSKTISSIVKDAEKEAENNARLLSSNDEKLSEEDKAKRAELLKANTDKASKVDKKEESLEDKEKRIKAETQRRIDEISSELKAEKSERQQDKQKIAALEEKLSSIVKPKEKQDSNKQAKALLTEQISKYLEEDKELPKDERREMSDEELEEWLLEEYVPAQGWLTRREIRRREEEKSIITHLLAKAESDIFISKQKESLNILKSRYPNAIPTNERIMQLRGKSREEVDRILSSESEDYKLMLEITMSDDKYLKSENGPELVADEMDKRKNLKTSPSLDNKESDKKVISMTEEEFQEKVKEAALVEAQRLAGLDEGLSGGNGKKMEKQEKKSEIRLKQERIIQKAGIPIEKLDAAIKRREQIGVSSYDDKD